MPGAEGRRSAAIYRVTYQAGCEAYATKIQASKLKRKAEESAAEARRARHKAEVMQFKFELKQAESVRAFEQGVQAAI